jgi:hypothetical protein
MQRAKQLAAKEGRPLSHLLRDALESNLASKAVEPATREAAYLIFCERPIRLTDKHLETVLEEDAWGA